MVPAERQLEILCKGAVDLHVRAELEERLREGKPLRVKAGFDPTRPDLHLGHTVVMQKMREFQDFGHTVIFVVGDFTAMVGDPTGKNELRPRLSREEVVAAAETYQAQAFKVLDRNKTVVRYNSEWLNKLDPTQMIELCAKYTVARMLERDDFKKRYEEARPIYVHEFMYPLLQAYDSVELEADIELGGTDQLFNLLVARDLMPRYGKRAQMVMTMPLLEGTNARIEDGKVVGPKMSKSADNYVGITEPPFDMLQKLMLVDDGVVWRYMELLSSRPPEEVARLREAVVRGEESVIAVKELFAQEIVTRFHSADDARAALERRRSVAAGGLPEVVEELHVASDRDAIPIGKALALAGLAKSTSEALRLVKGGAVHLDGEVIKDDQLKLERGKRFLVRVGSKNRRFAYLVVG
ncbi:MULTISPECIES: tyrosine--tRNA ligase [Sorangium]|uniref:Tyrosine--tRNA ligase n=1 Tax=Sorangium cellulosum TaxID=56 RepID=A0A4P2QGQ6_SORCE|nr:MULTISPECIES: tyrosine--tRNA ligase [Sorangium]AUX28698.1 tyrosyl-tRNA synthetase [Sorangium cellulosum]WCQ88095.1 Tyrosine--tRNA ligase [Sorangium sp. Soce836]